jgi:hypothetical protein
MRVLIACEFSGVVREAFRRRGHDAWSCDLLPTEQPGWHIMGDVVPALSLGFDLLIAHPPCTYLANSGVRWLYEKGTRRKVDARWTQMADGAEFFRKMLNAPIARIAVENPIMHCHAMQIIGQEPTQIVQPWQYGHGETKATCLWLKNLPKLTPSNVVDGRVGKCHREPPSPERWRERSRTYQGIADAMAEQWGAVVDSAMGAERSA